MGLPLPNFEAIAMSFLAATFFAVGLALIVWCVMDWYENR